MSHGKLKWEDGEIKGKVETLQFALEIKLVPIPQNEKRENGPSCTVYARNHKGNAIKIGAAWEKRKDKNSAPFYSITIDDPSFDGTLNLTAFPADGEGEYDIVWSRPRKKAA